MLYIEFLCRYMGKRCICIILALSVWNMWDIKADLYHLAALFIMHSTGVDANVIVGLFGLEWVEN